MITESTTEQSDQVSQGQLLAVVRALLEGGRSREDGQHAQPPSRWDAVVRSAFERTSAFGPRPEPWNIILASILARHPEIWDVIGGGGVIHFRGDEASLNPQPLPPREAFFMALAQTVISRAELIQDVADASRGAGEQQGIIIVSGYLAEFVDEVCGNGFRIKYPFPGPHPHWFTHEVESLDLVVMAAQFEQAANEAYSPALRQGLADASAKLVNVGLSKMQ
jgi:hypothetical protein